MQRLRSPLYPVNAILDSEERGSARIVTERFALKVVEFIEIKRDTVGAIAGKLFASISRKKKEKKKRMSNDRYHNWSRLCIHWIALGPENSRFARSISR